MTNCRFPPVIYLSLAAVLFSACKPANPDYLRRILVFTKTEGFRHHDAISAGQDALFKIGLENNLIIDTTEDASVFNDDSLQKYKAVILLNISGSVFSDDQRVSFRRFVQAGGGVLSIHAAADAERDWHWYGNLVGAYFESHPPVQQGNFTTVNKDHPATSFMPDTLTRTDEFYNFQLINSEIKVLVTLDENSYAGGTMGDKHPAVWFHEFDGGRSFYTSWGHSRSAWKEPLFLQQIRGGLIWVLGDNAPQPLDYSRSVPEQSRFDREELAHAMDEPMQMAILKNGNVFIAQRRGTIILYDATAREIKEVGKIPVLSAYEDGLLGIAADPGYDNNGYLFVFYAEPGVKDSVSDYRISRFTVSKEQHLDPASEKILIRIPHRNADGIHTGGGMMFDPRGSGDLYIAVGDNTSPRATLYAPLDERPGRELFNAQRTAANTDDLRGKVLRIHPEPSGTYTIPDGNLFPPGTKNTRPEIYSMGHRQPWRMDIDTKTGWLYLGEVGPDAPADSAGRGPMAYDEFNQIRRPGNFGWPYFGGNNRAYHEVDFHTGALGRAFDWERPANNSRLNTGIRELPAAEPAFIWYSNEASKEFPMMGRGARSAMGGPVFRSADHKGFATAFPKYYDGKWFVADWIRDWINVITMDEDGNYRSMERLLPEISVAGPIDLQFGPDGSLYILEYGKGWFRQNNDSKLVRISFNSGNRKPVPAIAADKAAGAIPLTVHFSAAGTKDYDKDSLTYQWHITADSGTDIKRMGTEPVIKFAKAGKYLVALTVTDEQGASETTSMDIIAGNEPPKLTINILKGNRSFFFADEELEYAVSVTDREDGSLKDSSIRSTELAITMDYFSDGFSFNRVGEPSAQQRSIAMKGGMIVNSNDCYHCHSIASKSIGPTFTEIAEKYKGDISAEERLAAKIINGGGGVWGAASMSAHPDLSFEDSRNMVRFILNLSKTAPTPLPVAGKHITKLPSQFSHKGVYVLHASYRDRGAKGLPSLLGEDAVVLRPHWILPSDADLRSGSMNVKTVIPRGQVEILQDPGSFIGYKNIDLSGIRFVQLSGEGNGVLELRIDSPNGKLIGTTENADPVRLNGKAQDPLHKKIKLEVTEGFHDIYFIVKEKSYSIKNYIIFQKD